MHKKEIIEIITGIILLVLVSIFAFDRLYYSHEGGELKKYFSEGLSSDFFHENKEGPFSAPKGNSIDVPKINFIKPDIVIKPILNITKTQETIATTTIKIDNTSTTSTVVEYKKIILPPESPVDYKDNNNYTITDNYTKLIWLKCTQGMSGKDCSVGNPIIKSWSDARNYCDDLKFANKTDWRLPTLKELQSLIDSKLFNPAINIKFFPNTLNSPYWTSTSLAQYTSSRFTVLFGDGTSYFKDGGNTAATRCVRDNI